MMVMMGRGQIHACVFDAYGTLFDVHSAVGRYRERLGGIADALSNLWRAKQLEYTWLRSLMRRHADFWQVTGEALDYAFESFRVIDSELRTDLMEAYLHLSSYTDVPEALRQLKRHGLKTAILSNGSPSMLSAAVRSAEIEPWIDAILSVEEVGIFKPDPRVYQLAVDRLEEAADGIAFLSSNSWDAAGAVSYGLRCIWVNRSAGQWEQLPFQPEAELNSLGGLPLLLGV